MNVRSNQFHKVITVMSRPVSFATFYGGITKESIIKEVLDRYCLEGMYK